MKLVFEKVTQRDDSSFELLEKREPAFDGRFHFHPEIEITLIERIESSSGRRLVGDSVDSFGPGDLVLLGENLPHQYVSDRAGPDSVAAAKVIKFRSDLIGDGLLRLPEFARIAALLKRSGRGLKFDGAARDASRELITRIFDAAGPKRLLLLLELLDVLSRDSHAEPIASAGYLSRISPREGDAVDKALQYLEQHFEQPVTLNDLSRFLHVSPATCNRLLQKSIGRSFKTALLEIRISHACRMLLETDRPIVQIAYASGFTNLSNFNRRFKQHKGRTPKAYRNLLRR